jgi:hypothetical protein
VQAQFNAWAEETGLSYVQLSRICALSIGENYAAGKAESMMGATNGYPPSLFELRRPTAIPRII